MEDAQSLSHSPPPRKRKVVDCFIFYNELQMLNYRIHLLNPHVDYFILTESTHTFSGKEKESTYQKYKYMFAPFNHKIIHLMIDDIPYKYPNINVEKKEQWDNERHQRNMITRAIDKLDLEDNDLIMLSDVDEIPDTRILSQIINCDVKINILQFLMDFYYYNLHCKQGSSWTKSKIFSYDAYKKFIAHGQTLDNIRMNGGFPSIRGGWHLSYFGDSKFISNKLIHFSHQEYNKEPYTNEESIRNKIENCTNLFDERKFGHLELSKNDYLPIGYEVFLKGFYSE